MPAIDAVVEQRREALGIGDSVGQLTLDRNGLEVGCGFLKNERNIGAGEWNGDDSGRRDIVNKGESCTLSHDLAVFIL